MKYSLKKGFISTCLLTSALLILSCLQINNPGGDNPKDDPEKDKKAEPTLIYGLLTNDKSVKTTLKDGKYEFEFTYDYTVSNNGNYFVFFSGENNDSTVFTAAPGTILEPGKSVSFKKYTYVKFCTDDNIDFIYLGSLKKGSTYRLTATTDNVNLTLVSEGPETPEPVSYTVYHLFESLSGDYAADDSLTEEKTGLPGSKSEAIAKQKKGFTAKNIDQITLSTDSNENDVSVYYTRNSYSIKIDTDGGSAMNDITYKYEEPIKSISTPKKDYYIFSKWNITSPSTLSSLPLKMPADNIKLKAVWTPITVTVNHYQQPVNGSTDPADYTLADTESGTGKINTYTAAQAKTYTGFSAQSFNQVLITGSEATVNIYYNRNAYIISFNTGSDASTIDPVKGLYGSTVKPPADPTRDNYVFLKWNKTIPSTMPAEDTEITAEWAKDEGNIDVIIY